MFHKGMWRVHVQMIDYLDSIYKCMLLRGCRFWFSGINVYMEHNGEYFGLCGPLWAPLVSPIGELETLKLSHLTANEQETFMYACCGFLDL